MLVHVIADYGPGDLAFAEVAQRLKLRLPDAEPLYTPVPTFATLAAGFCVAQLGLRTPRPPARSSTTMSRPAQTTRNPAPVTRASVSLSRGCPPACV